jgi:asparagine N-glycosylation enzyme membrane subunit Stt3
MEQEKILEERKEKFVNFLKKDKLLSTFLIISIYALISSILTKLGLQVMLVGIGFAPLRLLLILIFGGFFSSGIWFMLFIFSALSALLVYFNQARFSFYPLAAWVAWVAVYIRTLNLPGLRDITTGGWTLGPDLDPFLFLRWAKDIVAHGSLMAHDTMRYVPLGFDTSRELNLLSYMIAWFHKIAVSFGSTSVEQSAAIYPAVLFGFTVIAFFFFVRKIFISSQGEKKANIIALIASFFLSVIPAFIPRTIAGIPEKESTGFVFLFLAFYFFLCSWKSEKLYSRIIFGILAGASTALMALIWGGYVFIFVTIGSAVFLAFLLNQIDLNKFYTYALWLASAIAFTMPFTTRYSLIGWMESPSTSISFAVLGILIVHLLIFKTSMKKYFEHEKLKKLPEPIVSIIVAIILGVLVVSLAFGPKFILSAINDIKGHLITPITDRLGVTVAENRQPYFSEWADSFGPAIKGIPLTFWLFFIGSAYLFWKMSHIFRKKERIIMTLSYLFFLICIIFSRYSSDSTMNGTNMQSLFVYGLGFIALLGSFGYYYHKYNKSGELDKFKEMEFGLLMIFSFFFLCIVAARGAVRLTMMLVPPASIIIGYFVVSSLSDIKEVKDSTLKVIAWILVILILLSTAFAGYQFYLGAESTAKSYAPSVYNQQWQKAMSWVRESTPQNAVFGHWWDYGYWLQSIGERATVLDGGNSIAYWDYMMGRYALTGRNETQALEFLYAHNTTHFLIDSSDIGKYPAFSSIGSDENYDRYSWMNTFLKDSRQTQETKNSTSFVYTGGSPLDGDIIYNDNGTKMFIPSGGNGGLAGIIVERNNEGILANNPIAVFVYQNKQSRIPLRYAYDSTAQKLTDFSTGLDAGIFIFPYVSQDEKGLSIDKDGALMYLSDKTVMSQLARLYLYKEDDKFFRLAHSEDDFFVAQLKGNNITNSDFVYYGGIRGPIRIWEINYPKDIMLNPSYLETDYPDIRLFQARQ